MTSAGVKQQIATTTEPTTPDLHSVLLSIAHCSLHCRRRRRQADRLEDGLADLERFLDRKSIPWRAGIACIAPCLEMIVRTKKDEDPAQRAGRTIVGIADSRPYDGAARRHR